MVWTFSEAYRRAGFNGAQYIGVRPPKNAEKRQKPPKNVIFNTVSKPSQAGEGEVQGMGRGGEGAGGPFQVLVLNF